MSTSSSSLTIGGALLPERSAIRVSAARRGVGPLVRRYLLPEAAGTAAAVLVGVLVAASGGGWAAAAVAATWSETVAFYAVVGAREWRRQARRSPGRRACSPRTAGLVVGELALEFGPGEVLDTTVVRPALMYAGQALLGDMVLGLLAGKLAADVVFYAIAGASVELRAARATRPSAPPAYLRTATERSRRPWRRRGPTTPYLSLDLRAVDAAYDRLVAALPGVRFHYAVKANPHPAVLRRLRDRGCRFEIASLAELRLLRRLGVDARDVLYSNPVKPPGHVAGAFAAGVDRFAADSVWELRKLAATAPGSRVYVRLDVPDPSSVVPLEGKFGVDPGAAVELLLQARRLGLVPYGLTFHVGSQALDPTAYARGVATAGAVMRDLDRHALRISMLDIGGGLPARYVDDVPPLERYGAVLRDAVARELPYAVDLVAEPGRSLVAEAGTLVSTVIGRAVRRDRHWLHLDVGAFNGMMETLETRRTLAYPLRATTQAPDAPVAYDVTGPTCDSEDTMFLGVPLPGNVAPGDRVLIGSAGAYTTAYASRFNGFDLPSTVIVG